MFEKSLYDLIRGLRNHKGSEREYIQSCLRECRSEIRSQDMDVKATALLKLIYLEMVGHDMSWASFHVLEVMSSPKYHQKRVGYLGAVQTFRPDTEVLMLATNLLKKDLSGSMPTTIALPIAALPHIITPSLALSVLADLLPRMSHSHPVIRKKTLVTLYRLALVYPETLKAAWPKMKDRLMDKDEDPSVTAAIVNVICELGWRRPNDFLPLAPRLFELLVDGGNNWMAIKLIKLFATLTPAEPRLVRKLLPPLTNIIQTTPAMSLLYECINGIIQGGILGDSDDISGREEIASLCATKLRGMILMNSDPNLKYVALLAFNRIVTTHPFLVAQQEDAILECIDSEDITIRIKSLDLVQGMVSSDNLVSIVSRLMRQLKVSSSTAAASSRRNGSSPAESQDYSDEDDDARRPQPAGTEELAPLPEDYAVDVIGRILNMCSQNNYSNLGDFDWYLDILTQLVRIAPVSTQRQTDLDLSPPALSQTRATDITEKIGDEIRNIGVKVRAVRYAAVRAADSIIRQLSADYSATHPVILGILKPAAWVVGEYATHLAQPDDTLGALLQIIPRTRPPELLASSLQSSVKILSLIVGDDQALWAPERKSRISLLMARVIHVLEPLTLHPYLEVQERAVEFAELLKLAAEASSGQAAASDEMHQDPPLLLTQALPSLFSGWELNSVAAGAQKNVPVPPGLDLDQPIHPNLNGLLAQASSPALPTEEEDEFETYYNKRPPPTSMSSEPAINKLAAGAASDEAATSYQQSGEDSYLDPDIVARRKAERMERNRDDPFYIQEGGRGSSPGTSTPIHNILQHENGPDLDIDSIPIMQLDLDKVDAGLGGSRAAAASAREGKGSAGGGGVRPAKKPRQKALIAADETLGSSGRSSPRQYESENSTDSAAAAARTRARRLKQSLLQVDSSHIGSLSLDDEEYGSGGGGSGRPKQKPYDFERQQREDAEMAQAVKEVERLRLEMQRANERIQVAQGVPAEGTVIKKKKAATAKKKKKQLPEAGEDDKGADGPTVKKKKKTTKKSAATAAEDPTDRGAGPAGADGDGEATTVKAKKKKKAKRIIDLDDQGSGPAL